LILFITKKQKTDVTITLEIVTLVIKLFFIATQFDYHSFCSRETM